MLTELRKKSQITIPKDMVKKLGLNEGDKLEITEKDGVINIMPVVYPKNYLNELRDEIANIKKDVKSGKQPMFDSVNELFDDLDSQ